MTAEAASGARTIATALRRSPIYVAPSMAPALPERERLLKTIPRAHVPVFVIVEPIVQGGEWPDPATLADAVHRRLRRPGVYFTPDDQAAGGIRAYEYGVHRDAADAAEAADLDPNLDGASMTDRLIRAVNLIATGQAAAEYRRQSAALNRSLQGDRQPEHGTSLVPYAAGGGALVVAGLAGLLLWRRRRMAVPRPRRRTVARSMTDLREHAGRELVALGERLEDATGDVAPLQRALDAYAAAGKALDSATSPADLAGVFVLIDMGRDLHEAARLRRAYAPSPLCFFNPLHGDGTVAVRWRAVGSRERLRVRACVECAAAVRRRGEPEAIEDGAVPYYDADPEHSPWAATGYGQLRDDLIDRVLQGRS